VEIREFLDREQLLTKQTDIINATIASAKNSLPLHKI